jgi:hypothetical protein
VLICLLQDYWDSSVSVVTKLGNGSRIGDSIFSIGKVFFSPPGITNRPRANPFSHRNGYIGHFHRLKWLDHRGVAGGGGVVRSPRAAESKGWQINH